MGIAVHLSVPFHLRYHCQDLSVIGGSVSSNYSISLAHSGCSLQKATLSTPTLAVIAITLRGDEVILVQRRKEPQKGTWGYPGGSVEPGESLRDAALRELQEETGITAEVGPLIDVIEVIGFDPEGHHHHFALVALLCHYLDGELQAGDDAADCRWVAINNGTHNFNGILADHVADVAAKAFDLHNAAIEGKSK